MQQLLPQGPVAIVQRQRAGSRPESTWESPKLCCDTHTHTHTLTPGFSNAAQLHFSMHGSAVDLCRFLTFMADGCGPWAGFNQQMLIFFHFCPYSLLQTQQIFFPYTHRLVLQPVSLLPEDLHQQLYSWCWCFARVRSSPTLTRNFI